MANFKTLSRYTGGIVTTSRVNKEFLVLRSPLALEKADDDIFIAITQQVVQRPDLLSTSVYGTPDLWWVIYEFNKIYDPLFGLSAGMILRVPTLDRVLAALATLS